MSDIKLKGGRELAQFLDAFPKRLANNAVRAGLTASAKVIRDGARRRAPRETGKLARSIKSGRPNINEDGTVSIRVRLSKEGPAGEHAFLGWIYEYGSKAYSGPTIQRGGRSRKRSAKLKTDGGKVFGIYPEIPARAARPFLRPALDTKGKEAIDAMGERIRSYLKDKTSFTAPVTLEVDE